MTTHTSIKQIAEICECSVATVSNVLNGTGFFSEKTKEKVLKVVRDLRYEPNSSARGLRRGKTEIVGVVFYRPNADIFSSEFYLGLMRSFQQKLSSSGYDMILSEYTDAMVADRQMPSFILRGKADGVVILGGFPKSALETFMTISRPLLMLDTYHRGVDSITSDGKKSTQEIMRELSKLGHKRVAYFGYVTPDYNTDRRIEGFLAGVKKFGFESKNCPLIRTFKNNAEARSDFDRMLARNVPVPTAIVCGNDNLAISLMSHAKTLGYKIPGDFTFFGYDDIPNASLSLPPLSTSHTDVDKLGKMGASLILERIKNPDAPRRHIFMESTLVLRKSSAAV